MRHPTRRLITILALGWAGFLGLGLGLRSLSGPAIVVVIDHSFCPADQRQQIVNTYRDLYQQHQQRQIRIDQVLLISDLGEDQLKEPPTPEEIAGLGFFGDAIDPKLQAVQQQYPDAQILSCP